MAGIRISALTAATSVSSADTFVIVQGGTTKRATFALPFSFSDAIAIDVDSSSAALRVTQRGDGNAILVEDDTNPDSTPVVVNSTGTLVVGHTASLSSFTGSTFSSQVQSIGTASAWSNFAVARFGGTTATTGASFFGARSRGSSIGSYTAVQSGDLLVRFIGEGSDGTDFARGGAMHVLAGETWTASTSGAYISFLTCASGTSGGNTNLTEALRITMAQDLGIVSGKKLYLDGVAASGDTYLTESSADVFDFYAGGLKALSLSTSGASVAGAVNGTLQINLNNSHANGSAELSIGTSGTGDAYTVYLADSTIWSHGIDNSDSNAWVLSESASLGTSNRLKISVGGAVTIPSLTSGRVPLVSTAGLLTDSATFTYTDSASARQFNVGGSGSSVCSISVENTHASGGAILGVYTTASSGNAFIVASAGTGDALVQFAVTSSTTTWGVGADNSDSDAFVISESGTLGTNNRLKIATGGVATFGSTISTAAPTGGAGAWLLGIANSVSPTSPNRTLTVSIGGTLYYIHAKTTND